EAQALSRDTLIRTPGADAHQHVVAGGRDRLALAVQHGLPHLARALPELRRNGLGGRPDGAQQDDRPGDAVQRGRVVAGKQADDALERAGTDEAALVVREHVALAAVGAALAAGGDAVLVARRGEQRLLVEPFLRRLRGRDEVGPPAVGAG